MFDRILISILLSLWKPFHEGSQQILSSSWKNLCVRNNRLSKMCRAKKSTSQRQNIRQLNDQQTTDDDNTSFSKEDMSHVFALQNNTKNSTENIFQVNPFNAPTNTTLAINNTPLSVLIDSGSSIDVIDKDSFMRINRNNTLHWKREATKDDWLLSWNNRK